MQGRRVDFEGDRLSMGSPQQSPARARSLVEQERERDRELIARMERGDRDALGVFFDLYAPAALGLAQRILRNRNDAEDLVHDVFLEVWNKAGSYDPRRACARAWLMVRVRSRSIDRLRALEVARRHALLEPAAPSAHSERDSLISLDATRARAALDDLKPEQRFVIEHAYFEGLSLREISVQLAVPLGTVKSRLSAALTALRSALDSGAPVRTRPAGDLR